MSKTLYAKIWDAHAILEGDDGQTLLHVSRHFIQDGSNHAFEFLQNRGLGVRHPDQVFATPDHGVPSWSHTSPRSPSPTSGAWSTADAQHRQIRHRPFRA